LEDRNDCSERLGFSECEHALPVKTMQLLLSMLLTLSLMAAPPAVLFTDLTSGPNVNGENGNGAYVSIYGRNFGTLQNDSTVTIGNGAAASYPVWSDTKITLQLGPAVTTGAITVTVNGAASNSDVTFAVREGNIYFVSPAGSDSTGNGSFDAPWATPKKCKDSLPAGGICYIRDGAYAALDAYGAALNLTATGAETAPRALVAYPGERPVIGAYANSAQFRGIANYVAAGGAAHWTIAGLWLRAYTSAVQIYAKTRNWRIIDNIMECPAGDGATGCVIVQESADLAFLGNELRNSGCGDGPTGLLNDGVGASEQSLQFPCAQPAGPGTVSSENGVLITADRFNRFGSIQKGDVISLDPGSGPQERIIQSISASSGGPLADTLTVTEPFSVPSFSASTWRYRAHVSSKLYHTLYLTTDSNNIELGWNHVHNNSATHGLNTHSSPSALSIANISETTPARITTTASNTASLADGKPVEFVNTCDAELNGRRLYVKIISPTLVDIYWDRDLTQPASSYACTTGSMYVKGFSQYGLRFHHNVIHHQNGAGLAMATNDPSLGPVEIFGNLFYANGRGPGIKELYLYGDIYLPRYNYTGAARSGVVDIYNNTSYKPGRFPNAISGALKAFLIVGQPDGTGIRVRNNILVQESGQTFLVGDTQTISGANNLFFGIAPPLASGLENSMAADPQFVDEANLDFRLQPASPARDSGAPISGLRFDLNGTLRPQSSEYDLGAFEVPGDSAEADPPMQMNVLAKTPGALLFQVRRPNSQPCTVTMNGVVSTIAAGVRSVEYLQSGLQADTDYPFELTCGGLRLLGTARRSGSAGEGEIAGVAIRVTPPPGFDTVRVEYGSMPEALVSSTERNCVGGCTITLTSTRGSTLYLRQTYLGGGNTAGSRVWSVLVQ
jgi:hypothetical protein